MQAFKLWLLIIRWIWILQAVHFHTKRASEKNFMADSGKSYVAYCTALLVGWCRLAINTGKECDWFTLKAINDKFLPWSPFACLSNSHRSPDIHFSQHNQDTAPVLLPLVGTPIQLRYRVSFLDMYVFPLAGRPIITIMVGELVM